MDRRIYKNVVERGEVEKIYSSCCYLDSTTCLVGTNHGKLLVFEDGKKSFKKKISNGTIQNITFKRIFQRIYISDSLNNVMIFDS